MRRWQRTLLAVLACSMATASMAGTGVAAPAASRVPTGIVHPEVLVLSASAPTLLYPGSAIPLDLTMTNRGETSLTFNESSVSAVITTSSAACRSDNFALLRGRGGEVAVAAGATLSLSSLHVPRRLWPVLQMRDARSSQDACAGTTVMLRLSAEVTR